MAMPISNTFRRRRISLVWGANICVFRSAFFLVVLFITVAFQRAHALRHGTGFQNLRSKFNPLPAYNAEKQSPISEVADEKGGADADLPDISSLMLYVPHLGAETTPDEYCKERPKLNGGQAFTNSFMRNPWLFCGCKNIDGGRLIGEDSGDGQLLCEGGNSASPRFMKCDWTGSGSEKSAPTEGNPDGILTLCVPAPGYSKDYAELRGSVNSAPSSSDNPGFINGATDTLTLSDLAIGGIRVSQLDMKSNGDNDTVTPWIPPYNLPKEEYCAWRIQSGHARAHFLENPWLWCGCSKKGPDNRGTFLEDGAKLADVKVACQGDSIDDGVIPRSEKCVWTGEGSDRELPSDANPDGVPTVCVPSPRYATQYARLRTKTPTWKQSTTIPNYQTTVTPYVPKHGLSHEDYCQERLKMPGEELTQFMENPWLFCGCRLTRDTTGSFLSQFIENRPDAQQLCTGLVPQLPENVSPRASKCDWQGVGSNVNPDGVETLCVPKPEFSNLYTELLKLKADDEAHS